ncbi:tetratricopeptide repeat protein [Thiolapillus sp.]
MSHSLHIHPLEYLPAWEQASLHKKIRNFRLPDEQIVVCPGARLTASCFLSGEKGLGGVYDHQGRLLHASRHLRRHKDFTRANPPRISPDDDVVLLEGRFLYLGWFFNHYGHFMLESLSRCWPLEDKRQYDGYLFHFHARSSRPAARLLEFLDLLDIPREKLRFITRDLRVEELHVPTQQAVLSRAISPGMLHLYQQLGHTAWERQNCPQVNPKIYISRRLLAPDMRHASNEYLLERHFRDQGYEIFHPQLHPVREQLARFHCCTHLAGLEGSGLHHVLFAKAPQETFVLATTQRRADAITQAQLDEHRGCNTRILFQEGCPSPLLPPERTSLLLTRGSLRHLGIRPEETDPWSHALWLHGLAQQLLPHRNEMEAFARQARLTAEENRLLHFVLQTERDMDAELLATDCGKLVAALRQLDQGKPAAACALLESCQEQCRENPDFLLRHARVLRQLNQPDKASKVLQQALAIDPKNPDLLHLQAELLTDTGETDEARRHFENILRATPLYRPSLISLASLLAKKSEFAAAANHLTQALEIFVGNGGLYPRLTWYLMQTGDWENARASAETALRMLPQNIHSHAHLAHIWLELGDAEKALDHISEAIRRRPDNPAHYRLRARLHRYQDNPQAALADEQQAASLQPR